MCPVYMIMGLFDGGSPLVNHACVDWWRLTAISRAVLTTTDGQWQDAFLLRTNRMALFESGNTADFAVTCGAHWCSGNILIGAYRSPVTGDTWCRTDGYFGS